MNKLEILEKRKSCRDYIKKELVAEDRRNLFSLLQAPHPMGNVPGYELVFVEDGERAAIKLGGFAGYSGVMIEAPHYLAVFSKDDPDSVRKTAYAVEGIILKMLTMGIGSCWITVLDSHAAKISMGWRGKDELVALVALGYPKESNYFSRLFSNLKHPLVNPLKEGYTGLNLETKNDIPLREETSSFVYLDRWGNSTDYDELERRGLDRVYYYLKYAPSWGNRQPWKFIVDHDDIILCIHKNPQVSDIAENLDGGIAMFYFKLAMDEHGLSGRWTFDDHHKDYGIPEDYWMAGRFTF